MVKYDHEFKTWFHKYIWIKNIVHFFFRSVSMKWCQDQAFFLALKVLDTYISDLLLVNEAYPKCHSTGEQVTLWKNISIPWKIVQKQNVEHPQRVHFDSLSSCLNPCRVEHQRH
jgi:hypothetical protein